MREQRTWRPRSQRLLWANHFEVAVILTKFALFFVKNYITATTCLTKCAASWSPSIIINCLAFSLPWFVKRKRKNIFRVFRVTQASRPVQKKLNHGWRKFTSHFRLICVHVMQGFFIRFPNFFFFGIESPWCVVGGGSGNAPKKFIQVGIIYFAQLPWPKIKILAK